jgi:hypothetical protein
LLNNFLFYMGTWEYFLGDVKFFSSQKY